MAPANFFGAPQEKGPAQAPGQGFWRSGKKNLRAALRGPGARAFARTRDPGAGSVRFRHPPGAVGALAAACDRHGHFALRADLAGHSKGRAARVADRTVLDLDRVAVGA